MTGLRGPVVVSGTDTGVGKTITTAAIAAAATRAGLRVAVLKPAQTGVPDGPVPAGGPGEVEESDVDVVVRLAGPAHASTVASYPDPLAPATAARVSGRPTLELSTVVDRVGELQRTHDLVLIEGAGGLLVSMGRRAAGEGEGEGEAWTVAELAQATAAPVILVTRAGLGTLNHTALTIEALDRRGIRWHVVLGAWPSEPELVHRTNLEDLAVKLDGVLPEGAGSLAPASFRTRAPSWLSEVLHGTRVG